MIQNIWKECILKGLMSFDLSSKNIFNLYSRSLSEELKTHSFKILPNDKIIFYSKDMFSSKGKVSIDGAIKNQVPMN